MGFLTPDVHLRIAAWLEQNYEAKNTKLLLMAFRACGKSTIVGLFCAWLLYRNPNLRLLILAADVALARKMVRNIKRIIEHHKLTKSLKPAQADQWGSERFTVKRSQELRDPSVIARGILSNMTGSRADIIICDDVEVPRTCDTPDKRERLREKLGEVDFILTPGGTQLYVGTPHTFETIYATKSEDADYLFGFVDLRVPIMDETGASAWPERYPIAEIEKLKQKTGQRLFTSQMMLQPVDDKKARFDINALQKYNTPLVYSEVQRQAVLSIEGRKLVSGSAYWDPALGREGGDGSVVAVLFTDEAGNYYLHALQYIYAENKSGDSAAEQQCRAVAALCARHYVPSVTVEQNGIGGFLAGILRNELAKLNAVCAVKEISNRRNKENRILDAFDAVLSARKLFVHADVLETRFLREMSEWSPTRKHNEDDGLDAVAGAILQEPVRLPRIYGKANVVSWKKPIYMKEQT